MIGIELLGAPRQRKAMLPVAGIGKQLAEKSDRVAVHWVQGNSPLRRIPETLEFLLEEERLGQTGLAEIVGWRRCHSPLRGCESTRQGIGLKVESLRVILNMKQRQVSPGVAIRWRLLHRQFESR